MLFVAETVFLVTTVCTTARRRQDMGEQLYHLSNSAALMHDFSVSSGISLGKQMIDDIEDIAGVHSASVKQTGEFYAVRVIMETTDFANFKEVVAKELELSDKYPESRFDFDIDFVSTLNAA